MDQHIVVCSAFDGQNPVELVIWGFISLVHRGTSFTPSFDFLLAMRHVVFWTKLQFILTQAIPLYVLTIVDGLGQYTQFVLCRKQIDGEGVLQLFAKGGSRSVESLKISTVIMMCALSPREVSGSQH